jgi:cellulose synthase/poly-beta-1,6-N-acetylglucosamine synthase-like glycosyltransferase
LLGLFYFGFLFLVKIGLSKLKYSNNYNSKYRPYISIIIPFRNESKNILASLKSIEEQTYSKSLYEVIYIDDDSEDDSYEKLNETYKSSNIKIYKIPKGFSPNSHKKRAIKFGVSKASGEVIVGTDADCIHNPNWLVTLMSRFSENTGFVSGPVAFIERGGIFFQMQNLEFAGLVLVGAGLIGIKKPTLCNGANLAYKKKSFEKVCGFEENIELSSGDDEFLMQKIARETNEDVKFCFDKNAVVKTSANLGLKEFYHQRQRWASKSLYYKNTGLVLTISLLFLFFLSLPVQVLFGFFISWYFFLSAFIILCIKFILEFVILKEGEKFLVPKINLGVFLFAQLLHIPYILISAVGGAMGNYVWKDRKIKR